MVLLRRVIGDALRARRQGQHRTLREVSSAANVSLGYLSEIERGQKEASSELLAAICDALGARLSELLRDASDTVELAEGLPGVLVPVQEGPASGRDGGSPSEAGRREAGGPVEKAGQAAGAEPVQAQPAVQAQQAQPAVQAQPARADASPHRPALTDRTLRTLTEPGVSHQLGGAEPVRQITADGSVSVTVRQESPLKATLRSTRRIRPAGGPERAASQDRDVVCVG